MSFKNWYGTLLPFEAKALTREEIFQAGAASRDAEIAELQRKLANEQARDIHSCHPDCTREGCVNRRLRAELVNALAACKAKDEALRAANHSCIEDWPLLREALAIQPDTSALEAIVKKACEVMRERCAEVWMMGETHIRAIPAVTMEDLK